MNERITQLVDQLSNKLKAREWKIATVESCTGGGLAYALTSLAGSSTWFERGVVTYSNIAKEELVGVRALTLASFGAVSEQTVREMAEGGLRNSQAQLSIAITGIAGPEGGTAEKPVGTIWLGYASIDAQTQTFVEVLQGTRTSIREQTIQIALEKAVNWL
jgi:nicotinamide-nucleotide amidase